MPMNDTRTTSPAANATSAQPTDTAAAVIAGMLIGDPTEIAEGLYVATTPAGAQIHRIDTREHAQKYATHPNRKTGDRHLSTAESFVRYVNAHATGATAIYADKDATNFTAVLNDHEPEAVITGEAEPDGTAQQPSAEAIEITSLQQLEDTIRGAIEAAGGGARAGWGDFRAVYDCPVSIEWRRWHGNSQHAAGTDSKKGMRHADFIGFLEDNILDVTKPASGALLQMLHAFEAKKDVAFKSAHRLQDGSMQFNYQESVNQVTQDGSLSLPEQFEITIPVFDGGTAYAIDARLRYRVSQGGLMLWFELVSPHKVLEHAFNTVYQEIVAGVGEVPVYRV